MKIQPLKTIHQPNYPQKENVSAADLKTSIPKRWVTCSAAKVALGTLAVMSLVGCSSNGDKIPHTTSTKQSAEVNTTQPVQLIDDYATEGEVMVPMISVAPLFVHGDGRGTLGCIMVAPPVFMSEDEALVIINEVAKEYGLEFSDKEEIEFHEVIAPVTYIHRDSKEEAEGVQRQPATFVMDFADEEHNIALEYVSVDDVRDWNAAKSGKIPQNYNTQDAAEQLTQGLEFAAPDTFDDYAAGVIYDPCTYPNTDDQERHKPTDEERENAREDSISDLKQQVKDFFEWLRSQGII